MTLGVAVVGEGGRRVFGVPLLLRVNERREEWVMGEEQRIKKIKKEGNRSLNTGENKKCDIGPRSEYLLSLHCCQKVLKRAPNKKQ